MAAAICSEWCFPESIIAGVACHHGEASEPLSQLGALVAPLASLDDAQAVVTVVQAAVDSLSLDPTLIATVFEQACQAGPTLADQLI